jgi:cytoplasmic iron level regulating protein YaaA (DUF328/UPF0246 family)
MLMLLSPAKKLDYNTAPATARFSQPELMGNAEYLVDKLQKISATKIGKLMDLSVNLSNLNFERFQAFHTPFTPENAKQAVLAFNGDVYLGLDASTLSESDFDFAQAHLRILSGLYGLLKPLDLIQPYRLEMGTSFAVTPSKKTLYKYWNNTITDVANTALSEQGDDVLLNLASGEYFKAVQPERVKGIVINVHFRDLKNGVYKPISIWVKQARGMMARYVIQNRIKKPEDLKGFDAKGYYFSPNDSTDTELVFLRDKV